MIKEDTDAKMRKENKEGKVKHLNDPYPNDLLDTHVINWLLISQSDRVTHLSNKMLGSV